MEKPKQLSLFTESEIRIDPIWFWRKTLLDGRRFYQTEEWQRLRYHALAESNGRCECCGARSGLGTKLHVDHIKPRSRYPWLALDPRNLQVLCEDCNMGKSNVDETDWRTIEA